MSDFLRIQNGKNIDHGGNEVDRYPQNGLSTYRYWPPRWYNYQHPNDDDIRIYMNNFYHSKRNQAILSTSNHTKLHIDIYQLIIDYLPISIGRNETDEFINQYPAPERGVGYQFFIHHAVTLINRALVATQLIEVDNKLKAWSFLVEFKSIQPVLKEWINNIYWFRNSTTSYYRKIFILSDVLGHLKNGKYFYYKDGEPNYFPRGGDTHERWIYLIADDLRSLFKQMDKRDIQLFIDHEKKWSPLKERILDFDIDKDTDIGYCMQCQQMNKKGRRTEGDGIFLCVHCSITYYQNNVWTQEMYEIHGDR